MTKANKAGSQQPGNGSNNTGNSGKTTGTGGQAAAKGDTMKKPTGQASASPPSSAATEAGQTSKARQSGKSNRPAVGGTAVPGAKSTQPKVISQTNNPQQQQAESYNRTMRRRMQKLGTGPYSENPAVSAQERRQKRIERKKRKSEEIRQQVTRGPRVSLSLGRRNTYFLIGVAVLLVAIIVIAILLRHPF
jgi:preprotein translocase subunit SecF